jgi:hypothetical protein
MLNISLKQLNNQCLTKPCNEMEKLTAVPTSYLPLIDFSPEGILKLEGRAIPEDATNIFDPLIAFIDHLNVSNVVFDIKLEYFNTAASKKILEMLRHLEINNQINKILVNWHYEEGDDDSVETAELYEDCLKRVDFRYMQYSEVA